MKIVKREAKESIKEKEEKKARSRRGRSARAKGASFERTIAKLFQEKYGIEFTRTPMSGGFAKNKDKKEGFKGDIVPVDKKVNLNIHVECKSQKTWKMRDWLKQAKEDCPKDKIPLVIAREFGTPNIFVTMPIEGFFALVEKAGVLK